MPNFNLPREDGVAITCNTFMLDFWLNLLHRCLVLLRNGCAFVCNNYFLRAEFPFKYTENAILMLGKINLLNCKNASACIKIDRANVLRFH